MDGDKKKERIRDKVWEDIRHGNLGRTLVRDMKDLYEFYIDPKTRERLDARKPIPRWLRASFLILKQAILRLTPGRRILLLLSIVLALSSGTTFESPGSGDGFRIAIEYKTASYVLLLVVLMLELKDKLLARDELEAGRRIQLALLPDEQPRIPGWDVWLYTRPANDVGGDLIDHLPLSDSCHGLSLGDVAGKGLGAALLAAKLQATLRALAPLNRGMEWLGNELNRIFCRDCLPNRFSTLFYLEIDADSGTVHCLNAGHLPPLLLRESRIEELGRGDPALGLSRNTTFHPHKIDLNRGDVLLVFSDGLSEARDESGAFFGEGRIWRLAEGLRHETAEAAGRKILAAVHTFAGNARLRDDLSLIVLRRRA